MRHVEQLDGIRALAVLIVVIAHMGLDRYVPGGLGVTIFFFLSGYLITSLLRVEFSATNTVNFRNFYLRRFFRINPPLWITLIFSVVVVKFGLIHAEIEPSVAWSQFLFYTNYMVMPSDEHGIPITSLWSLAVEEHFYLIFPFSYYALVSRFPGKQAAALLLAAGALPLAIRIANVLFLPDYDVNYYWTHTRLDSILFGCCLAVWQNPILDRGRCYRPKPAHVAAAFAVLALCLVIRNDAFRQTFRYTLQGGALLVLFSSALQTKGVFSKILAFGPLRVVGTLSYTIYLVHEVFFIFMRQHSFGLSPVGEGGLIMAGILAYAGLMHYAVERPLAAVRRRLSARVVRTPAMATAQDVPAG